MYVWLFEIFLLLGIGNCYLDCFVNMLMFVFKFCFFYFNLYEIFIYFRKVINIICCNLINGVCI